MDNVISFPGSEVPDYYIDDTKEQPGVSVEKVIESLQDKEFDDIIVIGRMPDGRFYFATTSGNVQEVNWDLDKAKSILMSTMIIDLGSDDD
jgi:hypothetical protein